MSIKKLSSLFLLLILMLAGACTKNVPGPVGEAGKNGGNGNSTISHTSVFTVRSSAWDSLDTGEEIVWHAKVYVPEISSLVLRNGDIKVYALNAGDWFALPLYEGLLVTQSKFSEGIVNFYQSHMHGSTALRPADRNYRVVVLAPR